MTPPGDRFPLFLLLLLLMLICSVGGNNGEDEDEEDWTKGCPRGVCRCKWVSGKRTAECQEAGLTSLPDFKRPDRIQVLHVEGNPLQILPEKIFARKGLINLQKAYLKNCSLSEVDATAFEGLVILIELDLTHNLLRTLKPGTFAGNIRIRKLWLSHNPIRSLAGFSFPHIPHLRILDLSHCLLNKLSRPNFMLLEYLEVLHLNHNHFRRLDKRVFVPLRQLKSLTMESNPWQCDCRLQDFWRWLMANNLFSLPTACTLPDKLAGVTWDKLSEASLACPPVVSAPETMISVSSGGDSISLACLITAHPGTEISWVRSGMVIANNSRSTDDGGQHFYTIRMGPPLANHHRRNRQGKKGNVISSIDGSAPRAHNDRRLEASGDGRRRWFNLTIEHVHPSGSGSYACVAKNQGGLAEVNVTVVYTDSVATYLDESDLSALVVAGAAAGGLVFVLMTVCLVVIAARRRLERSARPHHHHHHVAKSGVEEHQLVRMSSSSGFLVDKCNAEAKTAVMMANGQNVANGGVRESESFLQNNITRRDNNFHPKPSPSSAVGRSSNEEFSGQMAMQEMAPPTSSSPSLQYRVQQKSGGGGSGHLKDFEMAHSQVFCAENSTNQSFDSGRTDSGCGSSINANNNSSNSSSGSSSSSKSLLLPGNSKHISAEINPHRPNTIPEANTSPSGCTSSSSSASIFASNHNSNNSSSNNDNAASSSTLAETSSNASTVKSSSYFDIIPPMHGLLDRMMWRGTTQQHKSSSNSSQQHLLTQSVENSCESIPYNAALWSSPNRRNFLRQEDLVLVRRGNQDISGDFTLPRGNPALVEHRRHLLPHHQHLQQMQTNPSSGSASTSSSPLRQHQHHHHPGFSPTDHLRKRSLCGQSPLVVEAEHHLNGHLRQQQQGNRGSLTESAAAAVSLLAQELEARKELLDALVKDKNDTIV